MTLPSNLRKLALTVHVVASVGWMGSVGVFLVLAVAGMTSSDPQTVQSAYVATELVTWSAIIPLAFASFLTGLIQSWGTSWGLFRHYWVAAKFFICILATALLLLHTQPIGRLAEVARLGPLSISEASRLQVQLVADAVAALVVLLVATGLSVYKPKGVTAHGRKVLAQLKPTETENIRRTAQELAPAFTLGTQRTPRWVVVFAIVVIHMVALFVIAHLTGNSLGGPAHHSAKLH